MPFHEFSNHSTLHFAAYIQDCINNYEEDNFFDLYFCEEKNLEENIITQMLAPQKESLLYSFAVYVVEFDYDYYLKKSVGLGDWKSIIEMFDSYKVSVPDFDSYLIEEDNDYFSEYIYDLRGEYVYKLACAVAKEVLEILFLDKILLSNFHLRIAKYLEGLDIKKYTRLFNNKGKVYRTRRWPKWLEYAVYFREHGRCAICGEDLSRLFFKDAQPNIDHIVPLALGGTNDTTNLQLLCKTCNLNKLDHTVETRNRRNSFFY